MPVHRRRYALLIGVDGYEDRYAIPPLRFCGADCRLLQQVLVRSGAFLPDDILVLAESGPHPPRA